MEYKKVKILHTSGEANYICTDLDIDGKYAEYDVSEIEDKTAFRIGSMGNYIYLNMVLKINKDDPKETLDRFFRLLMLQ